MKEGVQNSPVVPECVDASAPPKHGQLTAKTEMEAIRWVEGIHHHRAAWSTDWKTLTLYGRGPEASEEAWRELDALVCAECSQDTLEDNGLFGMGA